MILKNQVKFFVLVIILLGLGGYYFFIRIPLRELTVPRENHKTTRTIDIYNTADTVSIQHLDFDEPMFIATIVNVTKNNKLKLKNLSPSTSIQHNYYKTETLSLAVLGHYFDCINFIKSLLKLPYIISLTHLELEKSSQQQINLHIIMEIYHH